MKKIRSQLLWAGTMMAAASFVTAASHAQAPGGIRENEIAARARAVADGSRRLAPIPPDQLTDEQRTAMANYKSVRKRDLTDGLFMDLLRVPDAMEAFLKMRTYVLEKISFGDALTEFAELIVLREWNQRQEFGGHATIALRAGVKPELIQAVAEGRYPVGMSSDQAVIYHFITELMANKNVSDPTYAAMAKRFGERGVIEAITIATLYSAVGMVYNTVREPTPAGYVPLPDFPQLSTISPTEYSNPRPPAPLPGVAPSGAPPMMPAPRPPAPPPSAR